MEEQNRTRKENGETAPAKQVPLPQAPAIDIDKDLQEEINRKPGRFSVIEAGEVMSKRKLDNYRFTEEQEHEVYYIASDSRLSAMLEYEDVLEKFVDMLEHAEDQYSYCSSRLSECDRKIQDFLHELRMPKRNASEGFKLYQLGHFLQVERQAYKNAIELLKPLAGFAGGNEELRRRLQNILSNQRLHRESQENRIYMPRSELNLPVGDKFRSLSEEQQEKIRQNYQNGRRRAG